MDDYLIFSICWELRLCTKTSTKTPPALSLSKTAAGLCVHGGGFDTHTEVIISGINLNQHTRRDGWILMDGWMVAGEKRLEAEFPLKNLWCSQSDDHLQNDLAKILMWK